MIIKIFLADAKLLGHGTANTTAGAQIWQPTIKAPHFCTVEHISIKRDS